MFVATGTLPGWLQAFVKVNPISHLVGAVRGLMIGGPVAEQPDVDAGAGWSGCWRSSCRWRCAPTAGGPDLGGRPAPTTPSAAGSSRVTRLRRLMRRPPAYAGRSRRAERRAQRAVGEPVMVGVGRGPRAPQPGRRAEQLGRVLVPVRAPAASRAHGQRRSPARIGRSFGRRRAQRGSPRRRARRPGRRPEVRSSAAATQPRPRRRRGPGRSPARPGRLLGEQLASRARQRSRSGRRRRPRSPGRDAGERPSASAADAARRRVLAASSRGARRAPSVSPARSRRSASRMRHEVVVGGAPSARRCCRGRARRSVEAPSRSPSTVRSWARGRATRRAGPSGRRWRSNSASAARRRPASLSRSPSFSAKASRSSRSAARTHGSGCTQRRSSASLGQPRAAGEEQAAAAAAPRAGWQRQPRVRSRSAQRRSQRGGRRRVLASSTAVQSATPTRHQQLPAASAGARSGRARGRRARSRASGSRPRRVRRAAPSTSRGRGPAEVERRRRRRGRRGSRSAASDVVALDVQDPQPVELLAACAAAVVGPLRRARRSSARARRRAASISPALGQPLERRTRGASPASGSGSPCDSSTAQQRLVDQRAEQRVGDVGGRRAARRRRPRRRSRVVAPGGEHGEVLGQPRARRGEQVPAPLDDRPQRPVAGHAPCGGRRSAAGTGRPAGRRPRPAAAPAAGPPPARWPAAARPAGGTISTTGASVARRRRARRRPRRPGRRSSRTAAYASGLRRVGVRRRAGRAADSEQSDSPSMPSGSRLVASTRTPGSGARRSATSAAAASTRCSQLSTTSRQRRRRQRRDQGGSSVPRRASPGAARGRRPRGRRGRRGAPARGRRGRVTGASSTNQTPSGAPGARLPRAGRPRSPAGSCRSRRRRRGHQPAPVEPLGDRPRLGLAADEAGQRGAQVGARRRPGPVAGRPRAAPRGAGPAARGTGRCRRCRRACSRSPLVHGQRFGGPAGRDQRVHEQTGEVLAQRVGGVRSSSSATDVGGAARCEVGLDPVGERPAAAARRAGPRSAVGVVAWVCRRRAARPRHSRQRLAEHGPARRRRTTRRPAGAALGGQPGEPHGVDVVRRDREPVAGRGLLDHGGVAEGAAQPGHQGLQRVGRVGRLVVVPHGLGEPAGGHRAAGRRRPGAGARRRSRCPGTSRTTTVLPRAPRGARGSRSARRPVSQRRPRCQDGGVDERRLPEGLDPERSRLPDEPRGLSAPTSAYVRPRRWPCWSVRRRRGRHSRPTPSHQTMCCAG